MILATVKKQIVVLGPYFGQKVVQNSSVLDDYVVYSVCVCHEFESRIIFSKNRENIFKFFSRKIKNSS